jgi:APA family basic amino acid/polyamine antiporter
MAANDDLPRALAAVHPRYRVPHRAEVTVGIAVVAIVATADIRDAIGFSSFTVLTYYAIANAAALTLNRGERLWPRWLAAFGAIGCATLALTLPPLSVVSGGALLLTGALVYRLRRGVRR